MMPGFFFQEPGTIVRSIEKLLGNDCCAGLIGCALALQWKGRNYGGPLARGPNLKSSAELAQPRLHSGDSHPDPGIVDYLVQ